MRCSNCEIMLADDDKVCKYCGTYVEKPAPSNSTQSFSGRSKMPQSNKGPFSCCFGFFIFLGICVAVLSLSMYWFVNTGQLSQLVRDIQYNGVLSTIDNGYATSRNISVSEYVEKSSLNSFMINRGVSSSLSVEAFHTSEIKRKSNDLRELNDVAEFEVDNISLSSSYTIGDYTCYKLNYRINSDVLREEIVAARLISDGKVEYVYISSINSPITEEIIQLYLNEAIPEETATEQPEEIVMIEPEEIVVPSEEIVMIESEENIGAEE